MRADDTPPRVGALIGAVLAVAAAYLYFLLFAQFAFLDQLRAELDAAGVQLAMILMGAAGLTTSLVLGFAGQRALHPGLLKWAFLAAGLVAAVSPLGRGPLLLWVLAVAIGVCTAAVTVSLAVQLPAWAGHRLGLVAGCGTGLAYFVANLPGVFDASVSWRAAIVALAAAAGLVASQLSSDPALEGLKPTTAASAFLRPGSPGLPLPGLMLALVLLVWLDSATFAVVQQQPDLAVSTWGTPWRSLLQGTVHAGAAVAAGLTLDRGWMRQVLAATFVLFAVAFSWLEPGATLLALAGPLYAIGISSYSVALVVAPGMGAGLSLPRRAGLLFGVAGWVGSALGVGMAQDLGEVPSWFVVVAGLALGPVVLGPGRLRATAATWGPALLALALVALAETAPRSASSPERTPVGRDPVALGRVTYRNEGCISCHSQYVRPLEADVRLYGPARPVDRSEQPPMIGLRRQGSDLSNVGQRRAPEWLRAHLIDPRLHTPGSRMPSYAHLFVDSPRGDALVAYLESRGGAEADAPAWPASP